MGLGYIKMFEKSFFSRDIPIPNIIKNKTPGNAYEEKVV
jgi:hypothetical protein